MKFNKTLPNDMEAERFALSVALRDPEAIGVLFELSANDFYNEAHQHIFNALLGLYNQNRDVDTITVADQLRSDTRLDDSGGQAYLKSLAEEDANPQYIESYCDIVRSKSQLRKVIELSEKATQEANEQVSPDKIIDKVVLESHRILRVKEREEQANLKIFEGVLKVSSGGAFIPTGYLSLDRMVGGYPRGDICYIAARNSHGKSALLYGSAPKVIDFFRKEQLEKGEEPNAFIFVMTPDQHPDMIWAMEAGRRSGVPVSYLQERDQQGNRVATEEEVNKFDIGAAEVYADWPSKIKLRKGGITADQVEMESLRAIRAGAKMIVIDTIQRVGSGGGALKDTIQKVSTSLKDMAGDFNIPVVALSQVRRDVDSRNLEDGDGRRPQMNDISEAPGVIGNDAALILMLYQEARYIANSSPIVPLSINVAKNKSGAAGSWANNSTALNLQREFAHLSDSLHPTRVVRNEGLRLINDIYNIKKEEPEDVGLFN